MNTTDEDIVRDGLQQELGAWPTGFAPVDAAIRQGKGIKTRRRAVAGGTLAGLALFGTAAIVGLQPSGQGAVTTAPTGSGNHTVTVDPWNAASKSLWSGAVDGTKWSVTPEKPLDKACMAYKAGTDSAMACFPSATNLTDPAQLHATGSASGPVFIVGQVRDDVRSMVVEFTDGESVTMTPVGTNSGRYAIFAKPHDLMVAKFTALDLNGKPIAYAIPYNDRQGFIETPTWYRAGEQPPLNWGGGETVPSMSGTTGGKQWFASVEIGGWGQCIVYGGALGGVGPQCTALDPAPPLQQQMSMQSGDGMPTVYHGVLNPAVARVHVVLADGTEFDAPTMAYALRAYSVIPIESGAKVKSMAYLDSAGKQLVTWSGPDLHQT